jgi:hypothetical protein
MEIPKSSSTSSRPLAIGNSGILRGFLGDIFKMAVQPRRSAEFISEANARFFGHTTCPQGKIALFFTVFAGTLFALGHHQLRERSFHESKPA